MSKSWKNKVFKPISDDKQLLCYFFQYSTKTQFSGRTKSIFNIMSVAWNVRNLSAQKIAINVMSSLVQNNSNGNAYDLGPSNSKTVNYTLCKNKTFRFHNTFGKLYFELFKLYLKFTIMFIDGSIESLTK